jgi:hypothetical protein
VNYRLEIARDGLSGTEGSLISDPSWQFARATLHQPGDVKTRNPAAHAHCADNSERRDKARCNPENSKVLVNPSEQGRARVTWGDLWMNRTWTKDAFLN